MMKKEKITDVNINNSSIMTDIMKSKYLMIIIWLTLCTLLVVKRVELRIVFLSFLSSFFLAALLFIYYYYADNICEKITLSESVNEMYNTILNKNKLLSSSSISSSSTLLIDRIKSIEMLVGIIICNISMILLFYNKAMNNDNIDEEFVSLGIVTGYLAFDLWWVSLFKFPINSNNNKSKQQQQCTTTSTTTSFMKIFEDAITLSIFTTLLSMHVDETRNAKDDHDDMKFLKQYRSYIFYWLIYKFIRLVYIKKTTSTYIKMNNKNKKQLSDKVSVQNKDKSELWNIYGTYYNLEEFVTRHPGGVNAIELGKGRDCTALFESYHPFTNLHWKVLEKYEYNNNNNKLNQNEEQFKEISYQSTSKNDNNDPFYDVLKKRVYNELLKYNINPETSDRCATYERIIYYMFIFICLIISLYWHIHASIIGSFSTAIFGWLIGCIGHDAGHYSVSHIPWINDFSVWGISFICNPIMWQHQHTYAHHSHTNEFDNDPDLHHFTIFLKVHPLHEYQNQHKYQYYKLYIILSWFTVVLGTCIKIPLGMIFDNTLYGIVEWTDRKNVLRAIGFYFHYIMYIAIIILSPFYFGLKDDKSIVTIIACVLLHMITCGVLFAIFSQINHLNEMCLQQDNNDNDEDNKENEITTNNDNNNNDNNKIKWNKNKSWAASQIETSNNFATNSMLWHILSNGLNLQIEHHLFPGLNHCHLHLITDVVKETCLEYNVIYKNYESWYDIINDTFNWFHKLSLEK